MNNTTPGTGFEVRVPFTPYRSTIKDLKQW